MRFYQVTDCIRRLARIAYESGSIANIPASHRVWTPLFIWWPVWPSDEQHLFWLELVWRRRHPMTQQWEYRSFRTAAEKQREADDSAGWPPLIP